MKRSAIESRRPVKKPRQETTIPAFSNMTRQELVSRLQELEGLYIRARIDAARHPQQYEWASGKIPSYIS
jgi:hypothetical protein